MPNAVLITIVRRWQHLTTQLWKLKSRYAQVDEAISELQRDLVAIWILCVHVAENEVDGSHLEDVGISHTEDQPHPTKFGFNLFLPYAWNVFHD